MSEEKLRRVQPGWASFLWSYIYSISDKILEGDYEEAANILLNLMDFLPKDVKEALKDERRRLEELKRKIEEAEKDVKAESLKTPYDASFAAYVNRLRRSRLARPVVMDVIRRLTDILDERGYLEAREKRF